ETYHDRIRETIIANLPSDKSKAYHLALALALENTGNADPEMVFTHFHAVEDNKKEAFYAVRAAERAAATLSFERAARLYRLAIELEPRERAERQKLEIKLAEALANAGHGAEAAGVFLSCADYAEQAVALDLQQRAAGHFLHSGRIDEGLTVIGRVLKTVGVKWPKTPLRSLFSLLLKRVIIGLRGYKYRERAASEIDPEELLRIDACWQVSTGLVFVDTIRGADFQARFLLSALR